MNVTGSLLLNKVFLDRTSVGKLKQMPRLQRRLWDRPFDDLSVCESRRPNFQIPGRNENKLTTTMINVEIQCGNSRREHGEDQKYDGRWNTSTVAGRLRVLHHTGDSSALQDLYHSHEFIPTLKASRKTM